MTEAAKEFAIRVPRFGKLKDGRFSIGVPLREGVVQLRTGSAPDKGRLEVVKLGSRILIARENQGNLQFEVNGYKNLDSGAIVPDRRPVLGEPVPVLELEHDPSRLWSAWLVKDCPVAADAKDDLREAASLMATGAWYKQNEGLKQPLDTIKNPDLARLVTRVRP